MSKLTSELLLSILRDPGGRPLGVKEILARAGLSPAARTSVKRQLRELVRLKLITGEGKRYALRGDRPPEKAPGGTRQGPVRAPGEAQCAALLEPPRSARPPPAASRAEVGTPSTQQLLAGFLPKPAGRPERAKRVVGVLHLKSQGYGFVSPIAKKGEDLFLPVEEARGLADGDLIEVEIVQRQGGRSASRLIGVLERRRKFAVGRYETRGRGAVVVPRDKDLPMFAVEPDPHVKEGSAVRVRIPERPEELGRVDAVVGDAQDPRLESLSVAYGKGFSDVFSPQALAEAAAYPDTVTDEQRSGRRDLRATPLVTIDGEDARDFDDAVYVEESHGGTRVLVAIADVASYVRPGTALDFEALQRCTSAYFPDRVLPMLPERLSNGLCSLMPEVDRLCLVADLLIDEAGQTVRTELYPAVMRSAARCTYTQVAESLAGKPVELPPRVTQRFPLMLRLAETLTKMRERRGAIDFNLTEQKIVLGPAGTIVDVVPRERNSAHRLIEAFMLAANEAVAHHFLNADRASIFRVHDEPDATKLESFLELARAHGFNARIGDSPRPQALNAFLRTLDAGPGEKTKPEARALNALLLRSMMQAAYAAKNIGHYGLGAEGYLHFTSPIRRYPDLMVHRLLWAEWKRAPAADADELGAVAMRCSERERAAMSAEREIDAYYGTLWAREHVGETFHGTVDGVTEMGLFVEIDGHLVSGLVSADSLGAGAELEPKAHRFKLGRTGGTLGIGDSVEVEILSANVSRRQIDLVIAGMPAAGRLLDRPAGACLPGGRPQPGPRPGRPGAPSRSGRPGKGGGPGKRGPSGRKEGHGGGQASGQRGGATHGQSPGQGSRGTPGAPGKPGSGGGRPAGSSPKKGRGRGRRRR